MSICKCWDTTTPENMVTQLFASAGKIIVNITPTKAGDKCVVWVIQLP